MKTIFLKGLSMAAVLAYVLFTACNTGNTADETPNLVPVNSTKIGDFTVKLSGEYLPETGDNLLFWQVEKGGKQVKIESVEILPMMDMGDMLHACPFDTPAVFEGNDKLFAGKVVFIMPSGDMGSWAIEFTIKTDQGDEIEGTMSLDVASSWRLTSARAQDGGVYFITWSRPKEPVVGLNELHILLHKRESMMNFPAFDNAEVLIHPFMDMGGGEGHSTQFTEPAGKGRGLYEGSINYSMSGTWTTTVNLVVGNDTLPPVVFEYSVRAK